MPEIEVIREAGVRLDADIRGHRLVFDQPIDDGGSDLGPTPTEVFVASLAGCIAYYATRFLERHGERSDGLRVRAAFTMAAHPSRVESVEVVLAVPDLPETLRAPLLAVVDHCTVHNSLRLAPAVHIELDNALTAVVPGEPMTPGGSAGAGVRSTRR